MEELQNLYRLPLTGKLHSQKLFISVFKTTSSGTWLVFASSHGFSTLPSKATVRESPPSVFKAPTIESMIVILSVMCIVPKYHCLLQDFDIAYSEIIVSSRHLNFGGAPAFMFCFTKGGKRGITLSCLHTMLTTNLLSVSVSYCKLLVLCDILMRKLNY